MTTRASGRAADELRLLTFTRDFTEMATGSVLVEFGRTRVLCTASLESRVPPWLKNSGKGWVTAEYSMLPGSSPERVEREASRGKQSGRTQEIQRLIGRSLRAVTDLRAMPDVQITVDCDVLQADGGTRTASICGGWIALHDACSRLVAAGTLTRHPVSQPCAAISVGVVDGTPMLDLEYSEDVRAEVDMNVVMTGDAVRRGAGNRRRRGVHPLRARRAAGPGRGRHRRDRRGAVGDGRRGARAAPDARGPLPLPLVLATRNVDKAREIIEILVEHSGLPLVAYAIDVDDVTIGFLLEHPDRVAAAVSALPALRVAPDVDETGATLEANARIKATALAGALGLAAIADDTGLEVDALDGAPGVYAARYAGPDATYADNVAKLLRELEGVYPALRTARFATVATACRPDGREVVARGEVEGVIAAAPAGENGFGYDPVFVPVEGDGRTFAQMSAAEKHALSHRGRAFDALAAALTRGR